ncbi:MAG: Rieske 2Fe-2S domain-containing protein [Anaerolinea sp.]|nr:Rieske 2Fe-2S domain-containing protein [Anaerolinea sp.]
MATLTAGEVRASAPAASAEQVSVALPNRREFLYYIWGASIVLLLGQAGAALIWFALPRFKEGTFGGVFDFAPDKLPQPGRAPASEPAGRFHVSHLEDDSVVALYGVCTHLGCLPKWVEANHRFECPCHGSKFELSGKYIEGPAPRALDRFETTITFADGTTAVTNAAGDPIPLNGRTVARIQINTGKRIKRPGYD